MLAYVLSNVFYLASSPFHVSLSIETVTYCQMPNAPAQSRHTNKKLNLV